MEHNNDLDDIRYQKFASPITYAIIDNHSKEELGLDYGCGNDPVISKQLIVQSISTPNLPSKIITRLNELVIQQ